MMAFGMNGAALAAFGDIPGAFLTLALVPFGDKNDGVKLGDSTFKVFFGWLCRSVSIQTAIWQRQMHLSLCPLSTTCLSML